jgi:hypothetical protein
VMRPNDENPLPTKCVLTVAPEATVKSCRRVFMAPPE